MALRLSRRYCYGNISFRRFAHAALTTSTSRRSLSSTNVIDSSPDLNLIKDEFRQLSGGRVDLRKDEDSGIAFICLQHVEKKNGLSGSMLVDFNDIVTSLETWTTGKGLILYGDGEMFCSGGYLETLKKIIGPKDGYKLATLNHDTMIRLAKLPLVSVALVHGQAIGAGAEMTLWTDFRLYTQSAKCSFVEARMGVGTGWGGGTLLQRLVGHSRALELLLSCRQIGAEEAVTIGLADATVSDKEPLEESIKWLNNLVGSHHLSVVRTVKDIVSCDNFNDEKKAFTAIWGGPAQKSALSRNIKHK